MIISKFSAYSIWNPGYTLFLTKPIIYFEQISYNYCFILCNMCYYLFFFASNSSMNMSGEYF